MDASSVAAADADEQSLARRVFAERLKVFTERSIGGAWSSFIGTTLLAWIESKVAGVPKSLAWLVGIYLVEFCVIGFCYWHLRRKEVEPNIKTLALTHIVCSLLLGLAWGCSVWVFWVEGQYFHYLVNLAVITTVTALTLTIVSPFAPATWLFTFGILAPVWLHVVIVPNPFALELAVGLIVLFVVQVQYAAKERKQLVESLENGFRNQLLAERLRVAERQTQIAQEISATGTWVYDVATRKVWGSAEAMRIFGLPAVARELPYEEVEARIPDRERVTLALEALIQRGESYEIEYTLEPVDGSSVRHVRSIAVLDEGAWGHAPHVLGFIQDITKSKALEEQVRNLAFYDSLTKIANRYLLEDRLRQAIRIHARGNSYGALLFLDLDYFKTLNDRYGHSAGDQVLVEVAQRLTRCVRQVDTVARFGGDEFVVLMTDLSPLESQAREHSLTVAEKIRESLEQPYEITLVSSDEQHKIVHRCTSSVGGIVFGGDIGHPDEVLRRADAAMYRSKERGRNNVCLASPDEP